MEVEGRPGRERRGKRKWKKAVRSEYDQGMSYAYMTRLQ